MNLKLPSYPRPVMTRILNLPPPPSAQSDQRLFIRFLESIICKLAAGEISS